MATPIDYWFDLREQGAVKYCDTYAYGMLIDQRNNESDSSKEFTDLMAEALPVIKTDIDTYGIMP